MLTEDDKKALVALGRHVGQPGVSVNFAAIDWAPILQALLAGLGSINWSAIIAALLPAILPPGTTPPATGGGTAPTITGH